MSNIRITEDPRLLNGRARLVVTILGLGWLILGARLVQLQWWQQGKFAGQAQHQREFEEEVTARPGDIIDRQGRLLATTLSARSLYLVPSQMTNPSEVASSLSEALGISRETLLEKVVGNSQKQFLWVKRRLTESEVERVKQCNLPKGIWGFRDEYRREYPQGVVAAHVLGLRDVDGTGRGGVEESLDSELRGQNGIRQIARDSRGHVIEIVEDELRPAIAGRTIRLSLDVVVQLYAERELDNVMREWKPESCCAIVMDPTNGDVIGMATRPTFDPNHPDEASPESWKNRTIADIYEPGSTFKPMIVSYGIDQGILKKEDHFNCENGLYLMGRRLLHDHHRYGTLSLTDVLVKSSNIGMAKIGERMENQRLHEAATLFGFGRKTGIPLPGEQPGILRPLDEWTTYSTGSIPMGHEIATTPLQLIAAHAALANDGQWVRPRIVLADQQDSTTAATGGSVAATAPFTTGTFNQRLQSSSSGVIGESTVSAETARWMIEQPMQQIVVRGTGKKARIPGYAVFGKTGTAQCLSPDGGYLHGKYISSFVCGAPVQSPRLLVLVVVNQSSIGGETFGGKVAAPAAANILRQSLVYLRISPDDQLLRAAANWKNEDVD